MTADASSIWLAEPDASAVVRVVLATRQVEETVPLDGSPSTLAVGPVWAASVPGNRIDRIDRATERVTDHIPLGEASVAARTFGIDVQPFALAAGAGAVWIADWHGVGFTPIPGTGPHRVASANSHEIRTSATRASTSGPTPPSPMATPT
jgi:hypothetical protein